MAGRARSTHAIVRIALFLAAAVILPGPLQAQAPELQLEVDPDRVGLDDTFVVTVRVSGNSGGSSQPRLELGPNFRILGTSKAHSISFVNGRTTVEVRFQFTVQALGEGFYDVGPAVLAVSGQEISSGTARLQVVKGSVAPQRRAPADPWARLFGEPRARPRGETRAEVRMVAALDKPEAFVGEPVTYTLRLLTQQNVKSVEPRSEPQFTGFWAENVSVPDPPQGQKTEVDGQPYTAFLLKKTVLYPTAAGTLTIDPSTWGITLVLSDFFFGETSEITRSTEAVTLRVLPLPEAGKPEDFKGAVGELSLQASIDKTEAAVNDALSLKLTLSGSGNFRALPAPELPPLSDFRLYPASSTPAPAGKKTVAASSRSWEYVLVAKAPGSHVIPAIRYPSFDPARRAYRVLETEPIAVTIGKGAGEPDPGPAALAEAGVARRSVEPVRRDIAYLKLAAPGLGESEPPLYRRRLVLAALLLPPVVNLLAALYVWGRRRQAGDAAQQRRRSAHREARRKLKEASRAAEGGRSGEFAAKASEALLGYLGDRFAEPAQGLTFERIAELLSGRVDREQSAALKALFDRLDYLRFTPAGGDLRELKRLLKEAGTRLDMLERALGRAPVARQARA